MREERLFEEWKDRTERERGREKSSIKVETSPCVHCMSKTQRGRERKKERERERREENALGIVGEPER